MGARKRPAAIGEVAAALKRRYRDFDHYNQKDPLDELLFIVCSTKTEEASYRNSFRSLKESFPTHALLSEAPVGKIAKAIERGGLANVKAKMIREIMDVVMERFDAPTLEPLRYMNDGEVESFLQALPGVGKKISRCVMMYSLERPVFPVDTHCWRVSKRLGWVRPTQKDGHCAPRDMDRLQGKIPEDLRYSLHVNMVSLGREMCLARKPECDDCPIAAWCKKVGVAKDRTDPTNIS